MNTQRTVNLYPKKESPGAKNVLGLYSTPGLKYQVTGGNGPCRSRFIDFKGASYHVSGPDLVKIDKNNTKTIVGALDTNGGMVIIARGRNHLALVDGVSGYTWDGTTFAKITDPDFPNGATFIVEKDGYFIANDGDTDTWWVSAIDDPTDWSPLDFATAEAKPDAAVAIVAEGPYVYLIGEYTTQIYYLSGNIDFPFDLVQGSVLSVGTKAPMSVCRVSGAGIAMIGTDPDGGDYIALINGANTQKISDADMDWQLSQMILGDAIGDVYAMGGHKCYVLSFPSSDKTYAFDFLHGMWHERKSWGIGRYRAMGFGAFNGSIWCGDYKTGRVYTLDHDIYKDDGDPIERIRRSPVLHNDRKALFVSELEVEFEAGTTPLVTGQGSDPKAMLRYSTDGGHTWSNELHAEMGRQGEFDHKCVWYQLGSGYDFVFEVKVTDPVPVNILGAYLR